jgi:acyl carrier protein
VVRKDRPPAAGKRGGLILAGRGAETAMDVLRNLADMVCRDYLGNDRSRLPTLDAPLLASDGGVIDSVSMDQLILALEEKFVITVGDLEIIPEHFHTLRALASYVESKLVPR